MAAVVSMLGTVVLMLVLPCAMILCFVLQCYADYLRRSDAHALEAFRVQAQERRQMRQAQIHRGGNASNSTNNNNEGGSRKINLSEVFVFHTVAKGGDSIIECKDNVKNKKKIRKKSKKNDATINTTAEEPDGYKQEDCEDIDLEVGAASNKTSATSIITGNSFQTIHILLGRLLRGRANCGGNVTDKKTNKPSPSAVDADETAAPANDNNNNGSQFQKINMEDQECCCICLDVYSDGDIICKPIKGDCSHVFHKECISEWIQQENHDCCPLCRLVWVAY